MPNLIANLLPHLTAYRIPGVAGSGDSIHPGYGGQSISNLPATICEMLDCPLPGGEPLSEKWREVIGGPYRQVILLLVDGLGLQFFENFIHESPWSSWMEEGNLLPLTSIVPSTTSAALTSLWTGRTPIEHGILGYELWLKEFGMVGNMIFQSPAAFLGEIGALRRAGFQPETFLPVDTLGPHFHRAGRDVIAFQHNSIAKSGLSQMLLKDVDVWGFRTVNDLWVSMQAWLADHQHTPGYVYAYWGDIDELSHRYGPNDERVFLEFASFSSLLNRFLLHLRARGRGDSLFLMTADHGQIGTPRQEKYELRNHPELLDALIMQPTGENRLPYLAIHPGREEMVQNYLLQVLPGEFQMVCSTDLVNAGLFGNQPACRQAGQRLGDWVLIPQDGAYLWWADRDNPLLGRHGGMSSGEMLVPLFALRY